MPTFSPCESGTVEVRALRKDIKTYKAVIQSLLRISTGRQTNRWLAIPHDHTAKRQNHAQLPTPLL